MTLKFRNGKTKLIEGIKTSRGTLQGDPASPLRFNSIMHILMLHLQKHNRKDGCLQQEILSLDTAADDTVLFAETKEDLQALTNILSDFCRSLKLGLMQTKQFTQLTTQPDQTPVLVYDWNSGDKVPCKMAAANESVRYSGAHISLTMAANKPIRN